MNLGKVLEWDIFLFSEDKCNSILDIHNKSQIILGKSIHPWLEDVGLWADRAGGPRGARRLLTERAGALSSALCYEAVSDQGPV